MGIHQERGAPGRNAPAGAADAPLVTDGSARMPFTVRTSIATMTGGQDTEFGVAVDHLGVSGVHVFRGCVDLRSAIDGKHSCEGIPLLENSTARVERGAVWAATLIHDRAVPGMFVRDIGRSRRTPFDTAVWAREDDVASSARFIADGQGAAFSLQPAVMETATLPADAGDSTAPRWKTRYTASFTFEAKAILGDPRSLSLRGLYVARQYVSAIRINGRQVPVPACRDSGNGEAVRQFGEFSLSDGLVNGTNRLEIAVDGPWQPSHEKGDTLQLRLNLDGSSVAADWKTIRAQSQLGRAIQKGKNRKPRRHEPAHGPRPPCPGCRNSGAVRPTVGFRQNDKSSCEATIEYFDFHSSSQA